MKIDELKATEVRQIWIFRSEGVHPAWIDKNSLPIVAFSAVLEMTNSSLFKISPCEVSVPDKYPALGIEIERCTIDALSFKSTSGQTVNATELEESRSLMPFSISTTEESDPLGEGTVSQFTLATAHGQAITLRHIMPPMTLGLSVHFPAPGA